MALINTKQLLEAHLEMRAPKSFLLKTFWGMNNINYFKTTSVQVDIYKGQRKIAPYVHPKSQGITLERLGYESKTITPSKISLKRILDREETISRQPGFPVNQSNSDSDAQFRDLVARDMAELTYLAERAEELQARDALLTGTATLLDVEGATLGTLNYGRDSALTVSASPLWSDTGADPLGDLDDWRRLIIQKSEARPDCVIFSATAWNAFRTHPEVQVALNLFHGNMNSKTVYENQDNGAVYHGMIDGFELWTYDEWYRDSNGTEQPMIPAGQLMVVAKNARRDRSYGAVLVPDGLVAVDRYFRQYEQDDPFGIVTQMESFPLIIPTQVDTSLKATVL